MTSSWLFGLWWSLALASPPAAGPADRPPPPPVARQEAVPPPPATTPEAAQRPAFLDRMDLRLHSLSLLDESGESTSDNLMVLQRGYRGFGLGVERNDAGDFAFGAKLPLAPALDLERGLTLYLHRSDLSRDDEHEALISWLPAAGWEVLAKWFDRTGGEGYAAATLYQRHTDFEAPSNYGGGLIVASGLEREIGGYAWTRREGLGGFFAGAGRYLEDTRLVIGLPRTGGFTWRYFGIDADNGFRLDELLISTDGRYLKPLDFYSALIPIKATDAFLAGGGVFQYQVPPISARGRGITGGVIRRELPFGLGERLDLEVVAYVTETAFVGGSYSGDVDRYEDGTLGVPFGFAFSGDDGLTRNFLRLVPGYDQARDRLSLQVWLESRF